MIVPAACSASVPESQLPTSRHTNISRSICRWTTTLLRGRPHRDPQYTLMISFCHFLIFHDTNQHKLKRKLTSPYFCRRLTSAVLFGRLFLFAAYSKQ